MELGQGSYCQYLCNAGLHCKSMTVLNRSRLDEIPLENLGPAGSTGRQYELQSKSWDEVSNFISMIPRPTEVMNISSQRSQLVSRPQDLDE